MKAIGIHKLSTEHQEGKIYHLILFFVGILQNSLVLPQVHVVFSDKFNLNNELECNMSLRAIIVSINRISLLSIAQDIEEL